MLLALANSELDVTDNQLDQNDLLCKNNSWSPHRSITWREEYYIQMKGFAHFLSSGEIAFFEMSNVLFLCGDTLGFNSQLYYNK